MKEHIKLKRSIVYRGDVYNAIEGERITVLSKVFDSEYMNGIHDGLKKALSTLANDVKDIPADVVEVVRCKDCRHRDPEDHKCDCGHDILWQLPRDGDWFCADGERKGGADDP